MNCDSPGVDADPGEIPDEPDVDVPVDPGDGVDEDPMSLLPNAVSEEIQKIPSGPSVGVPADPTNEVPDHPTDEVPDDPRTLLPDEVTSHLPGGPIGKVPDRDDAVDDVNSKLPSEATGAVETAEGAVEDADNAASNPTGTVGDATGTVEDATGDVEDRTGAVDDAVETVEGETSQLPDSDDLAVAGSGCEVGVTAGLSSGLSLNSDASCNLGGS